MPVSPWEINLSPLLSAARIHGQWRDVYKDPVTDPAKISKKGRLDLIRDTHTQQFLTCPLGSSSQPSELLEVFRDGELLREWTLNEVRACSELA